MSSATKRVKATTVNPPIKWHGGKHYLAPKIIALMPPHLHYVEPYAGGLAVLLAKNPEGVSEVVNDLNAELASFWRVLRCPVQWPRFQRLNEATAFSDEAYEAASAILEQEKHNTNRDEGEYAWAFFVKCRQSLAGRMDAFAPLSRTRVRRGMNEQASAWLTAIEGLSAVHERMKRVVVLNRDALKVIRQQDGGDTLFYFDPPYMHETRATTGEYQHEMTVEQHKELLSTLAGIKGKFLLSGYPSKLYCDFGDEHGWTRHEFDLPNNAASGKSKQRKTECVWTNY